MSLRRSLKEFDGKHTDILDDVCAGLPRTTASLSKLLTIAEQGDTNLQVAATWILKKMQAEGSPFQDKEVSRMIQLLHQVSDWEARLHLLQILSAVSILPLHFEELKSIALTLSTDKNKLLRAWSYGVLGVIGDQDVNRRVEIARRLTDGEKDAAASVRARIRQMRKKYKWLLP